MNCQGGSGRPKRESKPVVPYTVDSFTGSATRAAAERKISPKRKRAVTSKSKQRIKKKKGAATNEGRPLEFSDEALEAVLQDTTQPQILNTYKRKILGHKVGLLCGDAALDLREDTRAHVDPKAMQFSLGDEGSYISMRYMEVALPAQIEVDKFIAVANSLANAHNAGYCHGDIRIDNMILESGALIDWDLARKADEALYPSGLQTIIDGKRHPDVTKAVQNRKIGELKLTKAHDWYSLKAAMNCFEPENEDDEKPWANLIENIESEGERKMARKSFRLRLTKEARARSRLASYE